MLSFDPVDALRESLARDRRPPDGKLHPSGDLIGSLRHAQLTAAGAPTVEADVAGSMPLVLGTLVHDWLERTFRNVPVMNEVKLDAWMPDGWSGTADAFFWNAEKRAFVLVDYKTTKPEGMQYILSEGVKDSHLWQVSAYWHAAVRMGIPLVKGFGVLYIPKSQLRVRDGYVTPVFVEATPLDRELVEGVMAERWQATSAYLTSLRAYPDGNPRPDGSGLPDPAYWLTDVLAPVQDRVQKLFLNTQLKTPVIDVKLVPHWSAEFCPFPDELCDCRHQRPSKIGHWNGPGAYVPRKDTEQPEHVATPDPAMFARLVQAMKEKT